jgi:hypothetical protein
MLKVLRKSAYLIVALTRESGNVPFGDYSWHMIMKVLLDECLSSKQKG